MLSGKLIEYLATGSPIINFSELEKLLKGTDKNLSALIKSLISQGIY